MNIKRMVCALGLLMLGNPASATPAELDVAAALHSAWTEHQNPDGGAQLPLDVQIFTELSPLIETEEGVRVPVGDKQANQDQEN